MATSMTSIDGHPLAPFTDPNWLPVQSRAYLIWELYEVRFRNGLYMVDFTVRKAHPSLYSGTGNAIEQSRERESQLRACWGGGDMKPNDASPSPFSVAETTPATLAALIALFEFMSVWPRSEDYLHGREAKWTLEDIDDLATMVWRFYAQTHFDYLRDWPTIPRIRPPLPW